MSDTTATMLQDKLNSIERNVYDGIDFSQEVTTAYVLADELGERIDQLSAENAKLRELCAGLLTGYECGHGELCKGCTWDGLGDPKTFPCLPRVKARELGVEVPS